MDVPANDEPKNRERSYLLGSDLVALSDFSLVFLRAAKNEIASIAYIDLVSARAKVPQAE